MLVVNLKKNDADWKKILRNIEEHYSVIRNTEVIGLNAVLL